MEGCGELMIEGLSGMLEDCKLDKDTTIKLLQGAYVAIDGLWFMSVEKAHGYDEALKMDLEVWSSWVQILCKRIKRVTGIEGDDLLSIVKVIKLASEIEGSDFEVVEMGDNRAVLRCANCRWYENLKKAGRTDRVPCDEIEEAIWPSFAKALNPKMQVKQLKSMPRGDESCDFLVEIKE